MKTFSMKCMAALLVLLLCVACTNTSRYVNVIPKDTPMVLSVNLYSLGEKSSLKDYKGMIDMGLLQLQKEVGDEAYRQLKQIVDDPSSLGIVLEEPMYIFATSSINGGGAVMKVSDGESLKDLLRKLIQQEPSMDVEEDGDRLWISMDGLQVVADNELLLLTVFMEKESVERLLGQTSEQSFQSTDAWSLLAEMKGDLRGVVAQDELMKMSGMEQASQIYKQMGIDMSGMCTAYGIDFLPGKVVTCGKSIVSDKMKEFQEKVCRKVDGAFLKKMPANPMLWLTIGLDGVEMYKFIDKIANQLDQGTETVLTQAKPYIESIDGELSFAINNVGASMSLLPEFTLYAEVKNADWVHQIQQMQGLGMSIGLINDRVFYATTNKTISANPGEDITPSLAEASWAGKVDGAYSFMVMESEPLKPLVDLLVPEPVKNRMVNQLLEDIEGFEMEATSLDKAEYTLYLKNKDVNALAQMIQLCVKMAL